jgi:adenine-specific DNA glycosylase
VHELPVKIRKNKRTEEIIHFAVIEQKEKWALYKRNTTSIWGGLYEFPRLNSAPAEGILMQDPITHRLSHKDLHCHFWAMEEEAVKEAYRYYGKEEMKALGMPIVVSNFVQNNL